MNVLNVAAGIFSESPDWTFLRSSPILPTCPCEHQRGERAMPPTAQDYRSAIRQVGENIDALPSAKRDKVYSLTLSGSLVRGDFRPGISDLDVHMVLRGAMPYPQASDEFGYLFGAIRRRIVAVEKTEGHNSIVDCVCVSLERLPGLGDGTVNAAIKSLGFYRFDLQAHHEVLWGEDFACRLPPGPPPRTMVLGRLERSLQRAEMAVQDPAQRFRVAMAAVEAVKTIQLLFANPPSIHKEDVSRVYRDHVPDFQGKHEGWDAWNAYLSGEPIPQGSAVCERSLNIIRQLHRAGVRFAQSL